MSEVYIRVLAVRTEIQVSTVKDLFLEYAGSLAIEAMGAARALGYERMRLDTLSSMTSAQRLYHSLGFAEIDPYYQNPVPDTVYLEAIL